MTEQPHAEQRPHVELTDPKALRAYAHPLRLSLVSLLRREGPLTATQAANVLGDTVPNCSFHLRQLAKYGLVERVEGADGREKPWRSAALATRWGGRDSDDPETRAAVDQLDAVIIGRYFDRARDWLARRDQDPPEWRAVTGPGDALLFLTAAELGELRQRMEDLLTPYRPRQSDPSLRPPDARTVNIVQVTLTQPPASP